MAQAADYIERAFDKLIDLYFIQMEQQTDCAELYGIVFQNFDIDDEGNLCFGVDGILDYLAPVCEENPQKAKEQIVNFVQNMKSTGIMKMINEQEFRDAVSALGEEYAHAVAYIGDDTIYGSDEGDILIGETGLMIICSVEMEMIIFMVEKGMMPCTEKPGMTI